MAHVLPSLVFHPPVLPNLLTSPASFTSKLSALPLSTIYLPPLNPKKKAVHDKTRLKKKAKKKSKAGKKQSRKKSQKKRAKQEKKPKKRAKQEKSQKKEQSRKKVSKAVQK